MDAVDAFLAEHPLTETVDLLLPDPAGIARGKRVAVAALRAAVAGELFFTSSAMALDVTGANVEGSGIVWEEGDADRVVRVDASTLRPVPWRPGGAQIIGGLGEPDGTPFFADCRQVLASVAARFAPLGLRPVAALEYEFFLLDRDHDADGRPLLAVADRLGRRPRETEVYTPERLEDQEAFLELVDRYATVQDVPIKSALAEFAAGQFELNLGHVDDALLAADQALMLKRCVKAAARATGQRATFMAKPFAGQSGSGLHVHLSLVDRQGRNRFGDYADGEVKLGHAVRGLLDQMPAAMLVMAPNANSYRRLEPFTYVPTAAGWGWNNRTVAVRVPPGRAADRRLEHRVAGADANPYLVLAAVLAGVLRGLELGEPPPPPVAGNAYDQAGAELPLTWEAASSAFAREDEFRCTLGERFCGLYHALRDAERRRFMSRVTPVEYEWYLHL